MVPHVDEGLPKGRGLGNCMPGLDQRRGIEPATPLLGRIMPRDSCHREPEILDCSTVLGPLPPLNAQSRPAHHIPPVGSTDAARYGVGTFGAVLSNA
jgi:hypothetical protein